MPPAPIRRIAVYVDEARDGTFRWILIEHRAKPPRWVQIEAAKKTSNTYREAMAAGLWVLQRLVGDLESGPRRSDAHAVSAPAEAAPPSAPEADSSEDTRGAHGPFGFGGLRG
ncbi:hypothetical protein QTH97_28095 [Variovorax sp. J22R24]|uniref:hypothetical protein n=1 Tax=Variovorax gracilis TaxID=3053502 RepID=UPI0025787CE9|nr:hypothetical protein [Variovorax sp. J22R24]MDM0108834.1 hypothetical protein [Variovorax sp. J22R24]